VESSETHERQDQHAKANDHKPGFTFGPEVQQRKNQQSRDQQYLSQDARVGARKDQINQTHNPREQLTTRSASARHPLESVLGLGLRRLLQVGIPLTAAALLLPAPAVNDDLLTYTLIHLTVLQLATLVFTIEVSALLRRPWFGGLERSWLASAVSLIAAAVGFSALLTLASSAAARYDVSLQFLQLLSSMDIAWVVAAIYLGSLALWGRRLGVVMGLMMLTLCVASIAVYLVAVGFTQDGGWLVSGEDMMKIVIPSDVVAAAVSLTILIGAGRRQAMEQAKDQSYS